MIISSYAVLFLALSPEHLKLSEKFLLKALSYIVRLFHKSSEWCRQA
jgi:hypothetical protein